MKKFIIIFTSIMLLSGCQANQLNQLDQTEAATQVEMSQPKPDELYKETNYYLHTQVEITTFGKLDQQIYDEVWALLDNIDQTMSMHVDLSDIAKINKQAGIAPVKVNDKTYALIQTAIKFNALSPKFDITIGPLVELWGIGSDNPHVPTSTQLNNALSLININAIELNDTDKSVFLKNKGMMIDLGAIAKGYAADKAQSTLEKHGIKRAIINFGGNILTLGGKSENSPWKIGIQNPDQSRGSYIGVLEIENNAVVTSGTYERFFEENGKTYHHILNTEDGMPVENGLWSVSIISPSATNCDALSTLIFAEGLERGLETINLLANTEAIFITKDRQIYLSAGLSDIFTLADDSFELK